MKSDIVRKAMLFCKEQGHRYTKPREHTLNILAAADKPLGAYDILRELSKVIAAPKPPTVYRAIQFWQTQGFIHCIESQKTYVVCSGTYPHTGLQFLVCERCGAITELDFPADTSAFLQQAEIHKFTLKFWTTELKGICDHCMQQSSDLK